MHNVTKYKINNYDDNAAKNETASARQGSAFDMKKDSVNTCFKNTNTFQLNENEQFDRKMTKIDVINKKALEL